ncbi:DUF2007 domain-containing protein [Aquabacterium sp.]|uniref:putative signal transducing protein n=1 Tax=Aquabacterium sp. TaxID=1872578 RepID=UPI002C1900C6|nr:DUF2007 domain-containing protein [Aquabacterium sp.]HSW03919.1 DUF2007 domain-containing protein [Aquabacterium sp.]
MRSVYEAANAVEAHMLQDLLRQEGIAARVDGEFLQGAAGELPAGRLVRLVVDEDDYAPARAAIERWEATAVSDPTPAPPRRSASGVLVFVAGLAVGLLGCYAFLRAPISKDGIDYNQDGVLDERWTTTASGIALETRIDRNLDGKVDYVTHFDQRGLIASAESDDNFDGVFETRHRFRGGNVETTEVDTNGDGLPDLTSHFVHGVLSSIDYIDTRTGFALRVERYRLGKLSLAEVDTDGDGKLDTRQIYSATAELQRTERLEAAR